MSRPKTGLLISISVVLAMGIVSLTIFFMYSTAIHEERNRLLEAVLIQAKLIEAVALFNATHNQTDTVGGARTETLSQIIAAYENYRKQDTRVEFVIGQRNGEYIKFLSSANHKRIGIPDAVPFDGSQIAEPMRKALSGQSGTIVGKDYHGIKVLAAYTPIPSLQIGLVEKITVDQLQAPFVRTGLMTATGSGLVIALGLLTLLRTTYSINRQLNKQTNALREGEARMRSILDHTIDGIITISTAGSIESFNPAAERTFGYLASEVIGENVKMLMPSPYHEHHDQYLTNYLQTEDRKIIGIGREVIGLRKDGSTFPMELGVSEILIGEEHIFTGLIHDITERKADENRIQRLNETLIRQKNELRIETDRAQKSDRVKSAFLATMSHELRTPLNSIIGFTNIALKQIPGPLNAEQTKQLNMVYGSSLHLLSLINDVLDISKIEAGELEVYFRPFDLHASIEKAMESVRPLAAKKRLKFEQRIEPDIGFINSDVRRVEQILINLLNNAIKFTEDGSVLIECYRGKNQIYMQVKDTGIGIKKENLALLFKPFQQVNSGLNREKEGTGLGLSICIRLSEMLQGTISVESEWGKGSVFTFTLPAVQQEALA